MALDISIDKSAPDAAPELASFDDFYAVHVTSLATALGLACGDQALGDQAVREALVKTSQQWKRIHAHPNVLGWAFERGIENAAKVVNDQGPVSVNAATGGYVRGLSLQEALAALPLHQRAVLVMQHNLGWSDARAAIGSGATEQRMSTLRSRATTFIAHHLHATPSEAAAQIGAELRRQVQDQDATVDGVEQIRNKGRRRTVRNRVAAVLGVAALIAVGAGLVEVTTRDLTSEPSGPIAIDPPSNSSDWLPPVSDGQGSFIALNTAGASVFARSADGDAWFEAAKWNSRSINLRTEVSGFKRTGDRYVATIEAPEAFIAPVSPYIATSRDLSNWTARQLEIAVPVDPAGLRLGFDVVNVVVANATVLAAVDIIESIDYASLDSSSSQVCVEVNYDAVRALHLCDGQIVTIERPSTLVAADHTRFMLAEGAGPFREIELPTEIDARSLVSDGTRFAATTSLDGRLMTSLDGRAWNAVDLPVDTNRFVLVAGDTVAGQLLAIVPSPQGWRSLTVDRQMNVVAADLDLDLDPSSVWTKPQLVAGPAGWALFVTTSRSWERVEDSRGWAVDAGTWIVSRLPDSPLVTARNEDTGTTYRFIDESDYVDRVGVEGVRLTAPDTDEVIVEITDDDITQSRSTGVGEGEPKAQVFFSADGQSWRSIWQSTEDTWLGSVAVGDDEVLISGATLTGPPISVPFDQ